MRYDNIIKLFLLASCPVASGKEICLSKSPFNDTLTPSLRPIEECAPQCEERNSHLRVGGSYMYVWITPEDNPTFQGNLGGVQAIYEYRPAKSFYAGVKFAYRQGNTHQDNQTRSLLDFDVHERVGYTFAACDCNWMASFYTGFGYRYLGQTLKQPGLVNLDFNYNEFYIPVGFSLTKVYNSLFSYGLNFTWMPQVFPSIVINPIGGANWVIERTLANALIELPLIFTASECHHLTIELKPFFEYWQDGKSVAVSTVSIPLGIPMNTYLFVGAEVNLGYGF